eukprot:TRINITY_DN7166_c0_g1_i1.p1 TRINITY_DN7166_c0_g1~~TRINITY_DN7166_c0_g1_i1.p1  ORF type:complete len:884 (-),score=187.85 TRINITY_DN7166_c0_g1_i1:250-2901(-)
MLMVAPSAQDAPFAAPARLGAGQGDEGDDAADGPGRCGASPDPTAWSAEDWLFCLRCRGIPAAITAVVANNLPGGSNLERALLGLTEEDLLAWGLLRPFDRRRLLCELRSLLVPPVPPPSPPPQRVSGRSPQLHSLAAQRSPARGASAELTARLAKDRIGPIPWALLGRARADWVSQASAPSTPGAGAFSRRASAPAANTPSRPSSASASSRPSSRPSSAPRPSSRPDSARRPASEACRSRPSSAAGGVSDSARRPAHEACRSRPSSAGGAVSDFAQQPSSNASDSRPASASAAVQRPAVEALSQRTPSAAPVGVTTETAPAVLAPLAQFAVPAARKVPPSTNADAVRSPMALVRQPPDGAKEQLLRQAEERLLAALVRRREERLAQKGAGAADFLEDVAEIGDPGGRQLSFDDFDVFITRGLKADLTSAQRRAFWRQLMSHGDGAVPVVLLARCLYRIELESWVELPPAKLERAVSLVTTSCTHAENWYKLFCLIDHRGLGRVSFSDLRRFVRAPRSAGGLEASDDLLPEASLQGFWRSLDKEGDMWLRWDAFISGLRRAQAQSSGASAAAAAAAGAAAAAAAAASAAASAHGSDKANGASDLVVVKQSLERALVKFLRRRRKTLRKCQADGGDARQRPLSVSWERFWQAMGAGAGQGVTLSALELGVWRLLGASGQGERRISSADGSGAESAAESAADVAAAAAEAAETQDGEDQSSLPLDVDDAFLLLPRVSLGALRALFSQADLSRRGVVTSAEWAVALYRLEVERWPDADEQLLCDTTALITWYFKGMFAGCEGWSALFRQVGRCGGGVSYPLFRSALYDSRIFCLRIPKALLPEETLKALWKAIDVNRSGKISERELVDFLRRQEEEFHIRRNNAGS